MNVHADREQCVSAGQCALRAPDVFDQDEDDGRVVVLNPRPDEERRAAVAAAVALCPSGAITVD